MTTTVRTSRVNLPMALTVVVALLYAWVGFASVGVDRAAGLLGAAAILAALAVTDRSRPAAVLLLAGGAVPLAVLTWWSVATPILALLGLLLGWPRRRPRPVRS